MPSSESIPARRSDTPCSRVTSISPSERSERGELLNPQQVRVERLAPVMHLQGHLGMLFGEPFLDPPRVRRPCPLPSISVISSCDSSSSLPIKRRVQTTTLSDTATTPSRE